MPRYDALLRIVFENTGEGSRVSLSDLIATLTAFLDHFGVKALVGQPYFDIIQTGDGRTKLAKLLEACGFGDDPKGFFSDLLLQLEKANGTAKIVINGVELPHLMLVAIMEVVLPGDKFVSIKTCLLYTSPSPRDS